MSSTVKLYRKCLGEMRKGFPRRRLLLLFIVILMGSQKIVSSFRSSMEDCVASLRSSMKAFGATNRVITK